MLTEPLPPIPSAPGLYWRRIRWKLAHALVFFGAGATALFCWQRMHGTTGFVGQVETVQTIVSCRDDGLITNLWVGPLQEVRAGDLVAEVVTTDPRTVNNRLEIMRDRMRLIQLEMEPVLNRQRGALTYEQLTVDCAKAKVDLAVAQVNLDRATSQLIRDQKLHADGLLSTELFELSRATKLGFEAEVLQRSNLVHNTAKALERLSFMADIFVPGGENDPLKQALAMEEEKVRLFEARMSPLRLLAPTNGVVTAILRHAGEQVMAGEPVAIITSREGGRIVGYLPQNFPVIPCVDAEVEVIKRDFTRHRGRARILGVSPNLESITNSLVPPFSVRPALVPQMGRVVSVSLPKGLTLSPGEPVDMRLIENARAGSARSASPP
jgi:multidrug resistance efflux pump